MDERNEGMKYGRNERRFFFYLLQFMYVFQFL